MATSTYMRGSNVGSSFSPQWVFETGGSSGQQHRLGEKLEFGDGTILRYVQAGAVDLAAGVLCQGAVPATDHTGLAVTTAAAGVDQITITNGASTALSANDYAEGYCWVDTGTNLNGLPLSIKSHPAALVNATCVLTLHDEIPHALTNGTESISLHKNLYKALIIHPSVPTARPIGVTVMPITATYYGWVCTRGPCSVITEGTLVIGNHAAIGDGTDGAVQPADTDTEMIVGTVLRVEGAGEQSLIFLDLE